MAPDWIERVVAGGPAAIFAMMWWLERTERKANADGFIKAMIETKASLEALVKLVSPQGRK